MAEAASTFISYSRTDSDFVDRLEADLRARGFKTWVDRRKLEGTREWQPQIDHAIAEYPLMIVVLSPDAIASLYVRHEYEYAHQLGKRIVTLLHRPNLPFMPPELSEIQWVDFVDKPYETALVELIDGCQDPLFNQASDPRILYNQAHDLESTDPERAAILYQRLINRASTYAGGRAQVDLDRLNQQLYPQRAQRLHDQAETARKDGQYGAEAGALKALIALGGQDRNMLGWAEEYLPIAEKNSTWLDTYENVKHCVEVNDKERARDLLTDLWQKEHAPFYRDPAGVASGLGLKVPITYEQWKEERQADATKAQHVQKARAIRDTELAKLRAEFQGRIKQETEQNGQIVKTVLRLTQAWKSGQASGNDRSEIETIERSLSEKTTELDPFAKTLLSRFVLSGQTYLSSYEEERNVWMTISSKNKGWYQSIWGWIPFLICWVVVIVLFGLTSSSTIDGMEWGIIEGWCCAAPPGLLFGFITVTIMKSRATQRATQYWQRLATSSTENAVEATSVGEQFCSAHNRELDTRVQRIENEQDNAIAPVESQYQQRMAKIAAEHTRTLADIEARYAGN